MMSLVRQKVVKYADRAELNRFFNYLYATIEEALPNAVFYRTYGGVSQLRCVWKMIELKS